MRFDALYSLSACIWEILLSGTAPCCSVKTRSIAVHKYPLGEQGAAALDKEATEECHAGRQQQVSSTEFGM